MSDIVIQAAHYAETVKALKADPIIKRMTDVLLGQLAEESITLDDLRHPGGGPKHDLMTAALDAYRRYGGAIESHIGGPAQAVLALVDESMKAKPEPAEEQTLPVVAHEVARKMPKPPAKLTGWRDKLTWYKDNAHEVWQAGDWTWYVLKKYQKPELEAKNLQARWYCLVVTPYVTEGELGDTYVRDVKGVGAKRIK